MKTWEWPQWPCNPWHRGTSGWRRVSEACWLSADPRERFCPGEWGARHLAHRLPHHHRCRGHRNVHVLPARRLPPPRDNPLVPPLYSFVMFTVPSKQRHTVHPFVSGLFCSHYNKVHAHQCMSVIGPFQSCVVWVYCIYLFFWLTSDSTKLGSSTNKAAMDGGVRAVSRWMLCFFCNYS